MGALRSHSRRKCWNSTGLGPHHALSGCCLFILARMGHQLRLCPPIGTGTGGDERVSAAVATVPGVDAQPLCFNARLAAAPPAPGRAFATTAGWHGFWVLVALC